MMERTGLHVDGPPLTSPVPATAKEIADTFAKSSQSLLDAVKKDWTDDTLATVDDMYGEQFSATRPRSR